MLYTGGRDGLVIAWDLGVPMKRRAHRYGITGRSLKRWEIMTNWADDIIEEEEEGEEYRSDGDVLGEVTGKARRRIPSDRSIPYEEQWETDTDAYQAHKVRLQLLLRARNKEFSVSPRVPSCCMVMGRR